MTTDLTWFYSLPPADRISLLRDPRQRLTGDLAKRLFLQQEAFMTQWLSNDGGGSVELSATAVQTLLAVRAQLDHWWQSLDGDQVDYIVQNRDGELDGSYRSVVQAASLDPVTHAPHGQLVVTVADNKTGRFRLPELIRIYVDVRQGVHPPA